MASYKQPCIHCGAYIDRDVRSCPKCGSTSPFGYHCPTCLKSIERGDVLCGGCGRKLSVACPKCGKPTFVEDHCEHCGAELTVKCSNPRCGAPQFFDNSVCTACGRKIKR